MAKSVEGSEKARLIRKSPYVNEVVANIPAKTTLMELAKKVDAAYVAAGGKSNLKATAHEVFRSLETMEALGIVKLTRPTDVFIERVKASK